MVESSDSNNPADWETFCLQDLVKQVEIAREEGKYLFLWDKNGHCPTFFRYKGQLVEVDKKILAK